MVPVEILVVNQQTGKVDHLTHHVPDHFVIRDVTRLAEKFPYMVILPHLGTTD